MASLGNNISTTISYPIENTDAQIIGLQAEDKIVKINNKTIHYKNDLDEVLENCTGEDIEVVVERNGETRTYKFAPEEEKYNYTGIAVYNSKEDSTKIAEISNEGPAKLQGLEVSDVILKINDVDVKNDVKKLIEEINRVQGEEIKFTIERDKEIKDILITPEVHSRYSLGVYLQKAENNLQNNLYYAFWETGNFAFSIIDNIKLLFTGNVSIDQMMGPVGIGEIVSQTSGLSDFIYILALISISLGFTNLLPFPPLDGGKVVILLIEAIRKKPIKEKTEITIQMIGFMILIGLSIYVTYNDILRIF